MSNIYLNKSTQNK